MIPGLALWQGTKHQYPLYDAVAMGVMVMVFAYILGRTDAEGRTVIETWADASSPDRLRSTVLSIVGVVVVANLLYGAVFTPHVVTKLEGQVTAGPTTRLFRECRINRSGRDSPESLIETKDPQVSDDPNDVVETGPQARARRAL